MSRRGGTIEAVTLLRNHALFLEKLGFTVQFRRKGNTIIVMTPPPPEKWKKATYGDKELNENKKSATHIAKR